MTDIPRIKCLPPLLANQIAAGEVIERPASVVKELLENAIDSGATDIEVSLIQGGLEKITVRDNGCGILAEDLPLALTRHATSKLNEPKDLFHIRSMGFRGEALASIAAVAKLTLTSRPKTQEQAWSLRWLIPDEAPQCLPASHPFGTSVTVAELFYNTPVRRQFLRSERTELLTIEAAMKRLALAHTNISFKLKHHDKIILHATGAHTPAQRQQRLAKLLSTPFLSQAIYVDIHHQGLHLEGWLSAPSFHRNQHDWIYWAVNQRPVRDKLLLHAFKQVYAYHLPPDRYPACALNLTLAPEHVDVNIHPTKHEVRFRDSRLVHDFIVQALTEAITPTSAELSTENPASTPHPIDALTAFASPQTPLDISHAELKAHMTSMAIDTAYTPAAGTSYSPKIRAANVSQQLAQQRPGPNDAMPAFVLHQQHVWIFDTHLYIIAIEKAFRWLMQHALSSTNPDTIKPLLFPTRIQLRDKPKLDLMQWQAFLESIQIHISLIHENIFLINAMPSHLHRIDIAAAMSALMAMPQLPDTDLAIGLLCQHIHFASFGAPQHAHALWQQCLETKSMPSDIMWQGNTADILSMSAGDTLTCI